MLVGAIINGVRYKPYEYVSVMCISCGVALFMLGKSSHGGHGHKAPAAASFSSSFSDLTNIHDLEGLKTIAQALIATIVASISWSELGGLALAFTNLFVDGVTNAEQDRINHKYKVSPYYMMAMVNTWSLIFASIYLAGDFFYKGGASELSTLTTFLTNYPAVRLDLLAFAFSNALGQVFIFSIISEFGALVLVTVTVTRKMITLFLSIIVNKHHVQFLQWVGVVSVCLGLSLKVFYSQGGHGGGHGAAAPKAKKA